MASIAFGVTRHGSSFLTIMAQPNVLMKESVMTGFEENLEMTQEDINPVPVELYLHGHNACRTVSRDCGARRQTVLLRRGRACTNHATVRTTRDTAAVHLPSAPEVSRFARIRM